MDQAPVSTLQSARLDNVTAFQANLSFAPHPPNALGRVSLPANTADLVMLIANHDQMFQSYSYQVCVPNQKLRLEHGWIAAVSDLVKVL